MIDDIKKIVSEKLKDHQSRLKHVFGVYETAVKLASIHNVDIEKASIAALFHDFSKYDPIEDQIKHMPLKLIKAYADYPVIYHAIAASIELEINFHIKDQDILNAIRYHVWGRPNMSILEKIIFVSDSCEPNRAFDDAKFIYKTATKDLDYAVLLAMKASIDDLKIRRHLEPSDEQYLAYRYYLEVNRGKTKQTD